MKAHARLWIDAGGNLCDRPPGAGLLIASAKGADIRQRFVDRYHLTQEGGVVRQNGKDPRSPESTIPLLVADRDLFVTSDGVLVDAKPERGGMKIADANWKIPREYEQGYNLEMRDGKVVQKSVPKPPNKSIEDSPNKSGGPTLNTRRGSRSSR
jgi:hypothetical protein